MTTTIALYSDGVQVSEWKTVDPEAELDLTYSITSGLWPVVVNQYGVIRDGVFGLRDAPSGVSFDQAGRYRLILTPPFS